MLEDWMKRFCNVELAKFNWFDVECLIQGLLANLKIPFDNDIDVIKKIEKWEKFAELGSVLPNKLIRRFATDA